MADEVMERQLQNWHNFCQYHANADWYGTWNFYSADAQVVDAFQCIRSFRISDDGSQIYHQNHYTYSDGKKETKTFGPYNKPIPRALYLDNCFSWGSTNVESGASFWFETGFRYENRRAGAVVMYNDRGNLQQVIVIPEQLETFSENLPIVAEVTLSGNWKGTGKTMTPDRIVSSPVPVSWKPLENLKSDYHTLHFSDGISIGYPPKIESDREFFMAVDWLIKPNLLQRCIRHYDRTGFASLSLEEYTISV